MRRNYLQWSKKRLNFTAVLRDVKLLSRWFEGVLCVFKRRRNGKAKKLDSCSWIEADVPGNEEGKQTVRFFVCAISTGFIEVFFCVAFAFSKWTMKEKRNETKRKRDTWVKEKIAEIKLLVKSFLVKMLKDDCYQNQPLKQDLLVWRKCHWVDPFAKDLSLVYRICPWKLLEEKIFVHDSFSNQQLKYFLRHRCQRLVDEEIDRWPSLHCREIEHLKIGRNK